MTKVKVLFSTDAPCQRPVSRDLSVPITIVLYTKKVKFFYALSLGLIFSFQSHSARKM